MSRMSDLIGARWLRDARDSADQVEDSGYVEHDGEEVGRQLLMTIFEAEHESYRWLNNTVCITEGAIDPVRLTIRLEVSLCRPDLG